MLFNVFYFLLFLLGLGVYLVLDYGEWANYEVSKKITSHKDKELLKTIAKNAKKGKRVLYIAYLLSLPFFVFNIQNVETLVFFILLMAAFLIIPPLRNLISNLSIKILLERKRIKRFLLTGKI